MKCRVVTANLSRTLATVSMAAGMLLAAGPALAAGGAGAARNLPIPTSTGGAPAARPAPHKSGGVSTQATTLTPLVVTTGSVLEHVAYGGLAACFSNTSPASPATDFTATMDWGDGTVTPATVSDGTVATCGLGNLAVSVVGHAYAQEGVYTVTVSIVQNPPGSATGTGTGTLTATENDVLTPTPLLFSARSGIAFTRTVATFTDSYTGATPSGFAATINWGDATTSAGVVSGTGAGFQVSGTHTYAVVGTYTATVTLVDIPPGTATATAASTAAVLSNLAALSAVSFSTPEATAFGGTVATFTDDPSFTPASFTATINWGDGTTTPGTVAGSAGSFTVTGPHTYADEGSFPVTVVVTETGPGGQTQTSSATATVTEADVLSGSPIVFGAIPGVVYNGPVATFTDTNVSNVASDFVATIDWGDGTTTAGSVAGSAGSFTVSGSHTYAAPGSFAVIVTLADSAPGTARASVTSRAEARSDAIPTLDTLGMMALGLLLALAGTVALRNHGRP